MPTYEYLCVECGNRREVVQSFTDEPLTVCEVCEGRLRKVIYPVGIQFKGSGFYSTDRRASHPISRTGKDGKADSQPEPSTDHKSESKSEGKSERSDKTSANSDQGGKSDSGASSKKVTEKSA